MLASKSRFPFPGWIRLADTLDHIRAVSAGGDNSIENVRPMCREHNEQLGRELGNEMKLRR